MDFNQLKAKGTELLGKATELAEQAKEKAGPLATQAKEKAGPLAEQALEKAGPLVEKAKDAAAKGVDIAADKIDDATGHKYSDKIESVSEKLGAMVAPTAPEGAAGTDASTGAHAKPESDHIDVSTNDDIVEPYPPTLPPAPGSTV